MKQTLAETWEGAGEWILSEIREECVIEESGWAPELVDRVADRLQAEVPVAERLQVVVYWGSLVNAFTVPGRYIFVCRPLLDRCRTEEAAAFVIAHELAHHRLGHLALFRGWTRGLRRWAGGEMAAVLAVQAQRLLTNPEKERDADRLALDLCLGAGYDPERCLELFDVLEANCLDWGRVTAVCGPDLPGDRELDGKPGPFTRLRLWFWERGFGYLPLDRRRAELRRHLTRRRHAALAAPEGTAAAPLRAIPANRLPPMRAAL